MRERELLSEVAQEILVVASAAVVKVVWLAAGPPLLLRALWPVVAHRATIARAKLAVAVAVEVASLIVCVALFAVVVRVMVMVVNIRHLQHHNFI